MTALDRTQQILERLVSFDTVSFKPNLDLITYVADYLKDLGVDSQIIYDEDGTKANLFATIGPNVEGGIVLSGHTDVVPVEGQKWTSPPFTLTTRDGNLYGRGTCDMKGFCAAVLAHVPDFLAAKPKIPIHLAFSYDEEIGCVGVRSLIDQIAQHLPRPRLVIVGEPTSMKVVNAHKGTARFKVVTWGLEAHSSQPDAGLNAILAANRLLTYLDKLQDELKSQPGPDDRFDPNYTTIGVGLINGGTASNIIPKRCEFTWEARVLPEHDIDELINRFRVEALDPLNVEMRDRFEGCYAELSTIASAPPLKADINSSVEGLIYALAQTNETHAVAFTTEAGLFQAVDMPTFVCGPGSIDQAHKADEFISLEQLEACNGLLMRLAAFAANPTH